VSVSEGEQIPVNMPGETLIAGEGVEMFAPVPGEEERTRAALLRATQPAGAVFALGWVMAELFDPRRRVSVSVRQPPFDPGTQLPQASDLAADPKLVFLVAELAEYLHWFPRLGRPLRLVTTQANKKKKAVTDEDLAIAEAAEQAAEQAEQAGEPDDVVQAEAASAAVTAQAAEARAQAAESRVPAAESPAPATESAARAPFSETALLAAVTGLNEAILDEFADDPQRLSAYQLGLALSDLVWLPSASVPGRDIPASPPSTLLGLFARPQLATVQTLLNGAGKQLPDGTATIVSRSLDNWADWIDVNSARLTAPGTDTWSRDGDVARDALRVQGWIWHSVLIADPEVSVQPGMGAWVEAGSSIARTARMTTEVILRRFWPLVVIALAALGGLLYLIISNLSGVSQVWASLVTVAAIVGSGSWGLSNGVSSALDGVGYEIWAAAKVDAAAWNVTWLPALTATAVERVKMERRGVAMPQVRKSLDI
jgi:hypothetical protein